MISAVTDGLGSRAAVSGYTVGGKTGSAEVSDDKSVPTHAWYNGFIYDDKSPLPSPSSWNTAAAEAERPRPLPARC